MSTFNTVWADNVVDQINSVPDCSDLQALMNAMFAIIQDQINAAIAQAEALILQMIVPTNLSQVITWIEGQIALVIKQYEQLVAFYAALITTYTRILNAIIAKVAAFSCTFSIPTITFPAFPSP